MLRRNANGALYLNIRGLYLKKNRNKSKHLKNMASKSDAPWIALTETWLKPDILSAEIQIHGYKLYRADREGRSHGGCALYVRNDLTCELVTAHSNMACDTLVVKVKTLNTLVIVNYRPPDSKEDEFQEMLEVNQDAIEKVTERDPKVKDVIHIGDFNFKCIAWPSKKIYSKEVDKANKATEKVQAEMLLKFAEANFLENCVTTPTRGDNTLDLCFTNNHSLINFYRTIVNKSFSDHNTLEFDLNFSYNTEKKKEKKKNPYETKVPEYDTENADDEDWLRFQKALDKVDVEKEFGGHENTYSKTSKFYKLLESISALVFKKKKAYQDEEEVQKTGIETNKNKIPRIVRQLMKKRQSYQRKFFQSLGQRTMKH